MDNEVGRQPETEKQEVSDFFSGFFKSEEFEELRSNPTQRTLRKESDLDDETLQELRSNKINPQDYVNFLNLRDKLASEEAGISVTTHIAMNGLSENVANLLINGSTSKKINDYTDKVVYVDYHLKEELKGLTPEEAKARTKYHDSERRELHNKAAISITSKWYASPELGLPQNLVQYLNEQGGNGLIELGRPLVSIIADRKIANGIGINV